MTDINVVDKPALPENPPPIVSIGAGGIVNDGHYPAYRKAGFEVAGVFDLNRERAAMMAEKFGVPMVYASMNEAIAGAPEHAVFDVAVPASAIPGVLQQLPDGRGVLIQKPMGESLPEARTILQLCQEKNLVAAMNFQLRYAPSVLAARSLVEQGIVGDVFDMEIRITVNTPWHLWDFLEGIPNVEILYHSIHYIDVIRAFLGEPEGVYAKTVKHPKTPNIEGSRTNIILDYGQMLRANITTNHHHEYGLRHQESYIKWEGTKGAIKAKMGLLLNYPKGEPDEFEYVVFEEGKDLEWQPVAIEGTWFPDAFIGTMSSLMRFVEGSADTLPTAVDDAFKTMAVTEAACISSEWGATRIPQR